jgi:hypothetical protein
MLFSESQTDTLFGLSNERFVFEEVHHAFKFCLLSFEKGGKTKSFSGAFRINPRDAVAADELESFLHSPNKHLTLQVELIRRLAPDSISVMEFKIPLDVSIAEKMLRFPLLGEKLAVKWSATFTAEFHMTNDSGLFKDAPSKGRLPLFEGKVIWQFSHELSEPRYWVDEKAGRRSLLGRDTEKGQKLDYQSCRIGFRDVAASTNERTLISTVLPPDVFCGNTLVTSLQPKDGPTLLFICAMFNSFTLDWIIRQKVTNHCNIFYMMQLPVPRLTSADKAFAPIVQRAAQLICTIPEFDALAKEVGTTLKLPAAAVNGVKDAATRAKLRAELDGLIANIYGLTEDELAHILTTFPLVPENVKLMARNALRDAQMGLIK